MNTTIQTYTGRKVDLLKPKKEDIHPLDIAWALSCINRFTGHCEIPYSVADHSVRVANMVGKEFAYEALLHDAAEAYTGDISTPLKNIINAMSGDKFKRLEENIEFVIHSRFKLPFRKSREVKSFDLMDFETSRRDIMAPFPYIVLLVQPHPLRLLPRSQKASFEAFKARWIELDPEIECYFMDSTLNAH